MASPNTNLGIFTVDALHSIANIAATAAVRLAAAWRKGNFL